MVKSDAFSFTINNYTPEDVQSVRTALTRDDRVQYLIFGREVGEQGTPHLQGYIQLKTRILSNTICKLLGNRARLDVSRGSDEDNYVYCSKDEQFEEFGERLPKSRSLKRKREEAYEAIRDDMASGASISDIAMKYPAEFIRHHAGILAMAKVINTAPCIRYFGPFSEQLHSRINLANHDWKTSVLVLGPTGLGKTQFILNQFENPLLVSNTEELKGFRRLEHDAIIFDDVSVTHWPRNSQLHLVDCEVHRGINVKGTHIIIPAFTKKVFTANPEHYPFNTGDPAISRRLTIIKLSH